MSKMKGLFLDNVKSVGEQVAPCFHKKDESQEKVLRKLQALYSKYIEAYQKPNTTLLRIATEANEQLKKLLQKPLLYLEFLQTLTAIFKSNSKSYSRVEQMIENVFGFCEAEVGKMSYALQKVLQKLQEHEGKEGVLLESGKKYSKMVKFLTQAIQQYKTAFQDVKLIYNMDEKTKRYKVCQKTFQDLQNQLQDIQSEIQLISDLRGDLSMTLKQAQKICHQVVENVRCFLRELPLKVNEQMLDAHRQLRSLLQDSVVKTEQSQLSVCFAKYRLPYPSPNHYSCTLADDCDLYPSCLSNLKFLKDQHFNLSKKIMIQYYSSLRKDLKCRETLIQILKDFFGEFLEIYSKRFVSQAKELKEILSQKLMKTIKVEFDEGSPSINETLKTSSAHLDEVKDASKRFIKIYSPTVNAICLGFDEELKLMSIFKEELKNSYQSLFGKKELKRDVQKLESDPDALVLSQTEAQCMKQDLKCKSEFIIHLVTGFSHKFQKLYGSIKQSVVRLLLELQSQSESETEITSKYLKSFNVSNKNIQSSRSTLEWFEHSEAFRFFVTEKSPLKFDFETDKLQSFNKLKKPQSNSSQAQQTASPSAENSVLCEKNVQESHLLEEKVELQNSQLCDPSEEKRELRIGKLKLFSKNFSDFLQKKVNFVEGEAFICSYTCGLADNIIVSGRLYITTHRVCFHSHFNSSNVFFGSTWIDIPKGDIRKIEKRYNAIIFDNSISVTTVNGEIFLTSFVSRDKAFNSIVEAFGINNDKDVIVSEENISEVKVKEDSFLLDIEQQDDMSGSELQGRLEEVSALRKLNSKDIKLILESELTFPGFTAMKFLRIFDSGQELTLKNKNYESFWHYFKGEVHKNEGIDITEWEPNILESLNASNIKKGSPLRFTRRLHSSVPTPKSNIPFMPSHIVSDEEQTLFLYSKDKYAIESKVQNSKAPYTNCFYIEVCKEVETVAEGRVSVKNSMNLVFVKKTMMKAMIESRSYQQSLEHQNSCRQEMEKYLLLLEKSIIKKQGEQLNGSQQKISSQQNFVEEQQLPKAKEPRDQFCNLQSQVSRLELEGKRKDQAIYFLGALVALLLAALALK